MRKVRSRREECLIASVRRRDFLRSRLIAGEFDESLLPIAGVLIWATVLEVPSKRFFLLDALRVGGPDEYSLVERGTILRAEV